MNNIERIAKQIAKTGAKNVLIHSIPDSKAWIVCQKVEENSWLLTLMEPLKNTTFTLGTIDNKQHLKLWFELINREMELKKKRMNTANKAKDLREFISNFIKREEEYANILKNKSTKEKTKPAINNLTNNNKKNRKK